MGVNGVHRSAPKRWLARGGRTDGRAGGCGATISSSPNKHTPRKTDESISNNPAVVPTTDYTPADKARGENERAKRPLNHGQAITANGEGRGSCPALLTDRISRFPPTKKVASPPPPPPHRRRLQSESTRAKPRCYLGGQHWVQDKSFVGGGESLPTAAPLM